MLHLRTPTISRCLQLSCYIQCYLCLAHVFIANTTKELRQRHKKNKPAVAINRMVEVIAAAIKTTLSIHFNRNMHCNENCAQTKHGAFALSVGFVEMSLKFWWKVNYPSFSKISKQWAYRCRKQHWRVVLTLRLLMSYIYIYIYIWNAYSWCF